MLESRSLVASKRDREVRVLRLRMFCVRGSEFL